VRYRVRRALLIVAAAAMLAACSTSATKGTMPPPGPNGEVDASSTPDFIAVAGRDSGIAGYARREDVLSPTDNAFPVYGDDLRTVVGQMVPGKGYVPVGVDPNAIPKIPVVVAPASQSAPSGSKVVIYVRNDTTTTMWNAVFVDGANTAGGGFWGENIGAGCYAMPAGSQLVLLDRSGTDPGASAIRLLYTRGLETEPPQLWVVADSAGEITQGVGVPDWWGDPLFC
jgi:hypothetical protein